MLENENMPKTDAQEPLDPLGKLEGEPLNTPETEETVSLDYVLKKVEAVQADAAHIMEAMEKIAALGVQDAAKICAIKELAAAREATNQKLLDFYTTLYNEKKRRITTEQDWAEFTGWIEDKSRSAGESAKKAGRAAKETAKDLGKMMVDWLKELKDLEGDKGNWTISVKPTRETSLKDKVLDALREPGLGEEDRGLILEYMDKLKAMTPEMQDQALDILTDMGLEPGEKAQILEHLETISTLDD